MVVKTHLQGELWRERDRDREWESFVCNTNTKIMEGNLNVANDELGQKKTMDDKPSKLLFSGLWWKQHWPELKPFVNGGAVGELAGSWSCFLFSKTEVFAICQQYSQFRYITKIFPGTICIHPFTMSQQLALYEMVRRKAILTNEGMQPTLCQEVACGLKVGAGGACISFPLYFRYIRKLSVPALLEQGLFQRPLFDVLHALVTRKQCRPLFTLITSTFKRKMWLDMGLLASYNPSLHYLSESCGFTEPRAQLGASAISAFFAAACSLPEKCIFLEKQETEFTRTSLDCALQILKSRGPLGFFTGFQMCFLRVAPPVMIAWIVLEKIRKLELSIGL